MSKLDDAIKEMQWWLRIKPDLPSVCVTAVEVMEETRELLKEPRKTKDEILLAIVSAIGYESVDDFKKTAEEVGTLDEFVFGMYRSINAVEKLFAKDGEQE